MAAAAALERLEIDEPGVSSGGSGVDGAVGSESTEGGECEKGAKLWWVWTSGEELSSKEIGRLESWPGEVVKVMSGLQVAWKEKVGKEIVEALLMLSSEQSRYCT